MAVRLRLMRMGKKKQPSYRIVAADARSPRDGRFLEIIGTYNPRNEPSAVKVDNAAALRWLQDGARPSEAVEKLLKISGVWESYTTGAPLPATEEPAADEPSGAEPPAAGGDAPPPASDAAAGAGTADEPAGGDDGTSAGDDGPGDGEDAT